MRKDQATQREPISIRRFFERTFLRRKSKPASVASIFADPVNPEPEPALQHNGMRLPSENGEEGQPWRYTMLPADRMAPVLAGAVVSETGMLSPKKISQPTRKPDYDFARRISSANPDYMPSGGQPTYSVQQVSMVSTQPENWTDYIKCYAKGQYNLSNPPVAPLDHPDFGFLVAPLPPNETERLAETERYDIGPEVRRACKELLIAARKHFAVRGASISIMTKASQVLIAEIGLNRTNILRELSLEGHTLLSSWPVVIPDTARDWRFAKHPLVCHFPSIGFWASAPIVSNGLTIGAFSVFDLHAREDFTPAQRRKLQGFADQAFGRFETQLSCKNVVPSPEAVNETDMASMFSAEEFDYPDMPPVVNTKMARMDRSRKSQASKSMAPASPVGEPSPLRSDMSNFVLKNDNVESDAENCSGAVRRLVSQSLAPPRFSNAALEIGYPFPEQTSTLTVLSVLVKLAAFVLGLDLAYFIEVRKPTTVQEQAAELDRSYCDVLGSETPDVYDPDSGSFLANRLLAVHGVLQDADADARLCYRSLGNQWGIRYGERSSGNKFRFLIPMRLHVGTDSLEINGPSPMEKLENDSDLQLNRTHADLLSVQTVLPLSRPGTPDIINVSFPAEISNLSFDVLANSSRTIEAPRTPADPSPAQPVSSCAAKVRFPTSKSLASPVSGPSAHASAGSGTTKSSGIPSDSTSPATVFTPETGEANKPVGLPLEDVPTLIRAKSFQSGQWQRSKFQLTIDTAIGADAPKEFNVTNERPSFAGTYAMDYNTAKSVYSSAYGGRESLNSDGGIVFGGSSALKSEYTHDDWQFIESLRSLLNESIAWIR